MGANALIVPRFGASPSEDELVYLGGVVCWAFSMRCVDQVIAKERAGVHVEGPRELGIDDRRLLGATTAGFVWSNMAHANPCEPECLHEIKRPFAVGDRLWVREGVWLRKHEVVYGNSCYDGDDYEHSGWECDKSPGSVWYATDGKPIGPNEYGLRWDRLASIYMPRWASRLTLEVTDIRPERIQSISPEDAIAEWLKRITKDGELYKFGIADRDGLPGTDDFGWPWKDWEADPKAALKRLWDSIYGKGPLAWQHNPWTWATTFKVVTT